MPNSRSIAIADRSVSQYNLAQTAIDSGHQDAPIIGHLSAKQVLDVQSITGWGAETGDGRLTEDAKLQLARRIESGPPLTAADLPGVIGVEGTGIRFDLLERLVAHHTDGHTNS